MKHPYPTFLIASQAASPDAAVLVAGLVGALLALVLDVYCIRYCLRDLDGRAYVTGGNKQLWAAIIILGGPLGQVMYWLYGRGEY